MGTAMDPMNARYGKNAGLDVVVRPKTERAADVAALSCHRLLVEPFELPRE